MFALLLVFVFQYQRSLHIFYLFLNRLNDKKVLFRGKINSLNLSQKLHTGFVINWFNDLCFLHINL